MKLTDDEKELVFAHRRKLKEFKELKEKRNNCNHDWRYGGHGHNDDWYICVHCGEMKSE